MLYSRGSGAGHWKRSGAGVIRSLSTSIEHSADRSVKMGVIFDQNSGFCDDGAKDSGVCGFAFDFVVRECSKDHA